MNCYEQILEATSHKAAAIQPPPSHVKTIPIRRTRHTEHCWRSKDELTSDVLLWTLSHRRASVGRPARTYLQQLCVDTGCKRWTAKWNDEGDPGKSVLEAQQDDDDDGTLSGATTRRHSEPTSNGNEGVLRIPQISSITGASPSNFVSYPRHSLGELYSAAEMKSVYSTAPPDWALQNLCHFLLELWTRVLKMRSQNYFSMARGRTISDAIFS